MKKNILTLIMIMLVWIGFGQTNVYHPFSDSNAVWNEYTNIQACQCNTGCLYSCGYYMTYFMQGDTIFDGHTYKKIYKNEQYYTNVVSPVTTSFALGLRQDTLAKKVYVFIPLQNNIDTLLYDFSLNLGDTVPIGINNPGGDDNYISAIDSILIGTKYRKQLHIASHNSGWSSDYVQIIEGIGSTFGLLAFLTVPFEGYQTLNCYTQNSFNLYVNPMGLGTCNYILSLKNSIINDNSFSIFPNPFVSSTNLTSDLTYLNVTIYDLFGQPVKQIQTNSTETVLSRDNLSSGLYFLRATKDNKTIASEKLVIVDN